MPILRPILRKHLVPYIHLTILFGIKFSWGAKHMTLYLGTPCRREIAKHACVYIGLWTGGRTVHVYLYFAGQIIFPLQERVLVAMWIHAFNPYRERAKSIKPSRNSFTRCSYPQHTCLPCILLVATQCLNCRSRTFLQAAWIKGDLELRRPSTISL